MLYSWLYAYRSTLFRLHPNRMVSPKYRTTKDIALGRIKFNASFAKSKVELYNFSNTIKWKYECVRCNAKIHSEREAEFYRWKKKQFYGQIWIICWSEIFLSIQRRLLFRSLSSFLYTNHHSAWWEFARSVFSFYYFIRWDENHENFHRQSIKCIMSNAIRIKVKM